MSARKPAPWRIVQGPFRHWLIQKRYSFDGEQYWVTYAIAGTGAQAIADFPAVAAAFARGAQ